VWQDADPEAEDKHEELHPGWGAVLGLSVARTWPTKDKEADLMITLSGCESAEMYGFNIMRVLEASPPPSVTSVRIFQFDQYLHVVDRSCRYLQLFSVLSTKTSHGSTLSSI
jgi:hypothetical protein